MSGAGGPHGDGVIVLYQNVKIAVTGGKIRVVVNGNSQSEKVVTINQQTGAVESQ
jgi:hypothetical protein